MTFSESTLHPARIPLTTVIIVGANGQDEELKAGEPALMSPELVAELAESGLVAEFTE